MPIFLVATNNLCQNFLNRQCCVYHRFSHRSSKSHYEELKVKENCSQKDIKAAYIALSKKYHPDVTQSKTNPRFLKISEAYNVLSKPESRRLYDSTLSHTWSPEENNRYQKYQWPENQWNDPGHYRQREWRQEFYYHDPYVRIQKFSNIVIVWFCIMISMIGGGIQFMAIKHSFTMKREDMIKRSDDAMEMLHHTRKTALDNGNEKQLNLLKEKLRDQNIWK